mmetsp:Transcript_42163/g.106139  ORF Transcript_42163/g.106139 Transcript_42163/m.106139 type:complete len:281 (-) Transcript_42163:37-879(-)
MWEGLHGIDGGGLEAKRLSSSECRRAAARELLDEHMSYSGTPVGKFQANTSKQNWADIAEEDVDNDVSSSPWFSSSTGAEGNVPNERPRKLKIKNKKLLIERGPGGSEGSAPLPRPAVESSSSDLFVSTNGSSAGCHKVWSSGNSTSSDMDSGGTPAASSGQGPVVFGKLQPPILTPEELAEIMQRVPLDEDGQPTSLGSIDHAFDTCRPCVFKRSKLGCHSGIQCNFCHLPHKRKSKQRPCKGKRDRHKKLIERVQQMMGSEGEATPREREPSLLHIAL